jgi:hypothetical protein
MSSRIVAQGIEIDWKPLIQDDFQVTGQLRSQILARLGHHVSQIEVSSRPLVVARADRVQKTLHSAARCAAVQIVDGDVRSRLLWLAAWRGAVCPRRPLKVDLPTDTA